MSFLNQSILWGLLAASIPVIVHLLNRRRHRTVKWAAMSFILKATRESRGKKKLKHLIILSARTLALAALIFAVAQPLVGGLLGWGGSKLDTVILVLDRSLSMETETGTEGLSKRQQAINQVMQTMKEMGNPKLILIDSASGNISEINPISSLDKLAITAATDTKSNIPALIEKATNYVQENTTGQTEVWIASDLQSNDWQPNSSRWDSIRSGFENLTQKPKLRILALTETQKDNKSISIKSIKRRENSVILDFEITSNVDRKEQLINVAFNLNGKNTLNKEYNIDSQTTTIQEEIKLPKNAINGHGYLALSPDGNNRDNNVFFAYGEATPAHTVIVTEGGESIQYLEKSAALPGFTHQTAERVQPNRLTYSMLAKCSLVIWKAKLPNGEKAKILTRFIEDGGSTIFFPSNEDSENSYLGINWGETQMAPSGQYFIVSDWNENDGPQRNYSNGESIPMGSLRTIKRRPIRGDLSSLADWDDGSTMIGRVIEGKGTAIFLNTLPNRKWSDLDIGTISVPVIQNLLNLGNKRFGSAFFSETGRNTPLAKEVDNITVITDNSKVNVALDDSGIKSNPLYEAGIKRINERVVATNRPAEEDSWGLIDNSELDMVFKGTNYSLFENKGQDDSTLTQQIWQIFLIAALAFLAIEAFLCLNKKTASASATKQAAIS